jgi:BirA family biotin operon repressor/biotin-[acetyl-CoA-carboxylase] ligase
MMRLDPAAASAGVGLLTYDTIDSTNAAALAHARAGARGPFWVVARMQTAGRGRHGRGWVSAPGNLHASLLLSDPAPPAQAPQLSFVAALALFDALVALAPALQSGLALKWPNDLLYEQAKLAGILVEGEGTNPLNVVIGIGVNCRQHPAGTDYPATSLAAIGVGLDAASLFERLSRTLLSRLAQWRRGEGFAALRQGWLARTVPLGARLRVQRDRQRVEGAFAGLDAAGCLLLRHDDGRLETIAAGEVFPLAAAAVPAD